MSFRSSSDTIFRRLIDRFELNVLERENVTVPSVIIPVCTIDDYLNDLKDIAKQTGEEIAANHYHTVPDGKRWTVVAVELDRDNTGDSWIDIRDPDGEQCKLTVKVDTVSHVYNAKNIVLDQGWQVVCSFGPGTLGTVTSKVVYREEDAF